MQSHGITLSFHREMADASRELVGPNVTAAGSLESYPRFIKGGFQDYEGRGICESWSRRNGQTCCISCRRKCDYAIWCSDRQPARLPHSGSSAIILCTADPAKVDKRTRSKWSRVLRYAMEYKTGAEPLAAFVRRKGGINACAGRFTRCLGRGGRN